MIGLLFAIAPELSNRSALEARWLRLTRETLPALAAARGWPVSADHCFQRVLLDHATGGCWYDHVAGRPAFRHLDTELLLAAVTMGEAVAAGSANLNILNAQSLAWRKARQTPPPPGTRPSGGEGITPRHTP